VVVVVVVAFDVIAVAMRREEVRRINIIAPVVVAEMTRL
jgi:hypothetical protein